MNKGLAFVVGCVTGAAGAGFITHTILKQRYAQKADEEIVACREAFQDELIKLRKVADEKEAAEKKNAAEAALRKYSGKSDDEPPFTPDPQAVVTAKKPEPKIQIIDEATYNDPANPHERKYLQYFPSDNVLMREDESIMDKDDAEYAIGLNALAAFDDEMVDSIWIRNDSLKRDYEITQVGMTYMEWKRSKHGQ